jgi:hypothetical protein
VLLEVSQFAEIEVPIARRKHPKEETSQTARAAICPAPKAP